LYQGILNIEIYLTYEILMESNQSEDTKVVFVSEWLSILEDNSSDCTGFGLRMACADSIYFGNA
jgi:hypothetical protein